MGSSPSKAEVKGLAEEFTSVLNVSFQTATIRGLVGRFISKHYLKEIESQEIKFNINFMPDQDTIRFLENAVFENIKGITAELQSRMQRELSQGLAAGEGRDMLRKRIADIFRGNNPTRFRFETRIRMIERTESIRAINFAQHDAAKQLPFKAEKRVKVFLDDRTSAICKKMHKKYGTDKKSIDLDKPFTVRVKVGRKTITVSEMSPPFHPNCRTNYVTVVAEEQPEDEEEI